MTLQTAAMSGAPETVELAGKVRARDRETSWQAASAQTNGKTAALQVYIYNLLYHYGPRTDDELRASLRMRDFAHTRSGVSTRRSELELAGWVRATDERRPSDAGKASTVWRAVLEDEPAGDPRPAAEPRKPTAEATVRDARAILAQGGPNLLERLRARLSA